MSPCFQIENATPLDDPPRRQPACAGWFSWWIYDAMAYKY